MNVTVCGVRGSTPTPGPAFVRYGGHTSCVAVAHDGEPVSLVLDAGTGIRRLPELLDGQPFRGTLLLGHLHWDHTQGLPFCRSIDHVDAELVLRLPVLEGDAAEVLRRGMSPPHFPIGPEGLRGNWDIAGIAPGHHRFSGFDVLAREIPHKGGITYGYRVSDGQSSIAYLSDHCPTMLGPGPDGFGELHPAALELATGVDLLFHDSQYTAEELPERKSWGHSAIDYAVALAETAGVGRLLLYHHDPSRTDDELDAIFARWGSPTVTIAREGDVYHLPTPGGVA